MTVQQDFQLGFKKEVTFKTVVTPDVFLEPNEETLDWDPSFVQGAGLRVSRRMDRSDRNVLTKENIAGDITVDLLTKNNGKLIEAALTSAGTSTLISGSAYQQLFTPTTTDYLNSYTIQKGVPPTGGGTTLPYTFNGMVCSGFEISSSEGIPQLTTSWLGAGVDTSTGLATASYVTGQVPFSSPRDVSMTIGGTVTVPTTTALATGGTAATVVRDFNCKFDNGLDSNGWNFGSTGKRSRKPALGIRQVTGNFVAEFDAVTYANLFLNRTETAITWRVQLTSTTGTAISGSVYPAFEITIPVAKLEGELPKSNAGDVVTLSMDFTGLDGGVAAHPFYVAIVTAETAI